MVDWLDVSDETPRRAYEATSGQTAFPFPFVFHDADHIKVYDDGDLIDPSEYTLTGVDDEDGGQVEFDTGRTLGAAIVIVRELPYELETHIPPSGALDIPSINLQFSLFVMMLQQAISDWPRSLRQPAADVDDLDEMPLAADRASKYLGFDADGQPVALSSVSTSVAATAFWIAVLSTSNSEAAARAALGIADQSAYVGLANWHHCR